MKLRNKCFKLLINECKYAWSWVSLRDCLNKSCSTNSLKCRDAKQKAYLPKESKLYLKTMISKS